MSYDLCLVRQAKKPYYIENIRTGIYSIEELCYYLYHNIYLIDGTIMNEGLCDWIRDELGLIRLYRQLYDQLEKKENIAFFIFPIFREIGYLTPQQSREFQEKLNHLAVQHTDVRQKLRGDYFVRGKMFARAIGEYRQILARQNPGKLGIQFCASVWNNLGAAYAGLFQYEQAADCFLTVCRMTGTKEAFRKYVSVLQLYMDEQSYEEKLQEVEADPYLVQKIQEYNGNLCLKIEPACLAKEMIAGNLDDSLQELKEQYCRSTRI